MSHLHTMKAVFPLHNRRVWEFVVWGSTRKNLACKDFFSYRIRDGNNRTQDHASIYLSRVSF